MTAADPHGFPREAWTRELVQRALGEDIGTGDRSTAVTVAPGRLVAARVTARASGVLAGLPLLDLVCAELDPALVVEHLRADGDPVAPGDVAAVIRGPAGPVLSGERTALNFLQHLGGIATLTARYAARVAGTRCRVLDTRKTLPGWRALAKYAVRCGGGHNHRMGLYDRIMLKDNHWAAAGGDIEALVARARREHPGIPVEIEVDDAAQLERALALVPDWILLDNFTPAQAAAAVARRAALGTASRLEASGNVDLESIAAYAAAGVDAASVGRLTHSAPALDLGLDLELVR